MAFVNEHFLKLPGNFLFADIAKKVNDFKAKHPAEQIISLGIGDVTLPLPDAVRTAMHRAVDEMGNRDTFRGYGPEQGYPFLIDAIIRNDYAPRGITLEPYEVFISDGAKSDTGNIGDILNLNNRVAVTDPVYPAYIDANAMAGRAGDFSNLRWSNIVYLPCTESNHFRPDLPTQPIDILFLCYPNNPTGTSLSKHELTKWVNFARENNTIIMFDAAYEAYIQDPAIPHSIYEIDGAKHVAIEFRSFSKTAGFTGVRCGYSVVPKELTALTADNRPVRLNALWNRRYVTKFNGASYISQRGAEASFSPDGKSQVKALIDYYMSNARLMRSELTKCGLTVFGGENAPYIWLKTPNNMSSWHFFEHLLHNAKVAGTPGAGFGPAGEGFLRLTAFGDRNDTQQALHRIAHAL